MPERERKPDARTAELLAAIARGVDEILNGVDTPPAKKQWGFVLGMFRFNEPPGSEAGRFNYVSNCRREDILRLLDEMREKFAGEIGERNRATDRTQ